MPRRRAPPIPIPSAPETAEIKTRLFGDSEFNKAIRESIQAREAARASLSPAQREQIEKDERQHAEGWARVRLREIGCANSLELLIELFGLSEVGQAFRRIPRSRIPARRALLVWMFVELRRAVFDATPQVACHAIAGRGGIRGMLMAKGGAQRNVALDNEKTLLRDYRRAVARLNGDPDLHRNLQDIVRINLGEWRASKRSFDYWEQEKLKKPGWAFR